MFSQGVTFYMFFAGAGSGLSLVVFALDSFLAFFKPRLFEQSRCLIAPGLMGGLACVCIGAAFLFFDLGRAERLMSVFVSPRLTVLVCGAWSLAFFIVVSGVQLLLRLCYAASTLKPVHIAIRWLSAASALAVMLYTGLLLQDLRAVHFWNSGLLPLLFALSSLTGGFGLLMLIGFFKQGEGIPLKLLAGLTKVHIPLLLAEMLVLGAYLALALERSEFAAASVWQLVTGAYALPFWGGVVVCGLLAPLVLELFARHRITWTVVAQSALVLLAGTLALRYCFLMVGMHPAV